MTEDTLPDTIADVEQLDELLSRPTPKVVEALSRAEGDIVVLGAAGKMGPTLARMARRASDQSGLRRRVIGVSRFNQPESRRELEQAGRLLPGIPWSHYDTCHVTFRPAQMTPEQLREGYDWLCRRVYSTRQIATRGWRFLRRHSLAEAPSKLVSSISSDLGYRYTYNYRNKM